MHCKTSLCKRACTPASSTSHAMVCRTTTSTVLTPTQTPFAIAHRDKTVLHMLVCQCCVDFLSFALPKTPRMSVLLITF